MYHTHGLTHHPLYKTWKNMLARCNNPSAPKYPIYGGRGIRVCERWHGNDGIHHFIEDMGERPEGATLDRRDNSGDYTPENCRWATHSEQNRNRRFMGVHFNKKTQKWVARIQVDRKSVFLGEFMDFENALLIKEAAKEQLWQNRN